MIALLGSAFAYIFANLKWVAIILATLAVLLVGWKFYSLTSEVASSKAEITRLEKDVNYKKLTIEMYQAQAKSVQEALEQREQELQFLQSQVDGLQVDLPEDAKDDAPSSTQEFLHRLRGKLQ